MGCPKAIGAIDECRYHPELDISKNKCAIELLIILH
jgi:hypothetical protein